MCTFLVLQESPCHSTSGCSLLQHPWLEVHCLEAGKRLTTGGWYLGLHELLKQWVESGLNHHLKLKILRMSEDMPQGYSHISVAHPSTFNGLWKVLLDRSHGKGINFSLLIQACLKRAEIGTRLMACSGGKRNWVNSRWTIPLSDAW